MSEKHRGFVLGNHEFLDPSENAPISRMRSPKKLILGAPPPTYLDGVARETTPASPAAQALLMGRFCGHGEPTMTIFDIVIDGAEILEVGAIADPNDLAGNRNLPMLAARKPGGQWRVLFRREWEEAQATLEGTQATPLSGAEAGSIGSYGNGRVAIGFEYPADATSRDVVSWIAIDVLFEGECSPGCVVNAELA